MILSWNNSVSSSRLRANRRHFDVELCSKGLAFYLYFSSGVAIERKFRKRSSEIVRGEWMLFVMNESQSDASAL